MPATIEWPFGMGRYLEIGAEASAEEEALPRMSRGMVSVISALGNFTHLEIEYVFPEGQMHLVPLIQVTSMRAKMSTGY